MADIVAYAVKDAAGNVLLDTLYGTQRGAKVNWLFVHAGVPIYQWHVDADIERMFDAAAIVHEARLVELVLTERTS